MTEVWIVMYTEDHTGTESIKGVFSSEKKAKKFIAEYVLSSSIVSEYLDLVSRSVDSLEERK